MALSPFSLVHDWYLKWQKRAVRQKPRYLSYSTKQKHVIESIAAIGVIGGEQLFRFYNVTRKERRKMTREGKLIRHVIKQNDKNIPIFTLGPTGADVLNLANYEPSYWVKYDIHDVLKRLLFFELFYKFPKANIMPAPSPFIGGIKFRNNLFYVYVVRGDIQDLLLHLKWQASNERLIIVTESLNHLQPLNVYAKDLKARVTTDDDLLGDFNDMFYKWNQGWKREY